MESRNWLSFLPVATTGWNCIPDLPQTLTKIIFLCWSVNVNAVKKLFRTFPSWRKIEVLTLGLWKPTASLLKCDILKTAAIRVTWDNPDCNHSYETPSFCLPAYQEGELAWNVGSEQINACLVFNNLMELFCFYALLHICQNLVFSISMRARPLALKNEMQFKEYNDGSVKKLLLQRRHLHVSLI